MFFLQRKYKALMKNVVVYALIFFGAIVYSLRSMHVVREAGEVHVGLGAVHGAQELHLGVTGGCWKERLRGPLDGEDPRVIQAVKDHHLHPPNTKPYNLDAYTNRLNYKDMESWKFLHERIVRLLGKRPPGFFVEAGALDGEYLSNTLHLEKVYGWTGLLVEPNPNAFKHLLKKNRRAWSSNTCLAITPYPKLVDTRANAATTQALWVIRGSSFLMEAGGPDQQYQGRVYDSSYATVQCFPLVSYLRALNITKVDLLSLDVEGAEQRIMDTLPWNSLEISFLLLEHHGDVKGKDTKFVEGVVARGYSLYDYHIDKDNIGDYIFVKDGVF
ncbi:protein Star-like isoform X2 [Portunus trituberculatus]|uniref:protein Star-like isoform X2 n=1 Tax=Portunus trituberculatus TaxID=210409 RepID=UPI001E1CD0AB|nr:protein Star-like isoform X2 [Portunus trituberculatus]